MIDTDKYEGHTPGPWMWYKDDGDVDLVVANDQCYTVLEEVKALYSEANENLIADAPLLLEEVKRLREELFNIHAYYSDMEQMLAFAVGIKQGLLTDMSMDDLLDAVNRDYHDRLNEHMDGKLKNNR